MPNSGRAASVRIKRFEDAAHLARERPFFELLDTISESGRRIREKYLRHALHCGDRFLRCILEINAWATEKTNCLGDMKGCSWVTNTIN